MEATEIIKILKLEPLEIEGGYFRRTYTSPETVNNSNQNISSAIFYLITPDNFSSIHKLVNSDEIFHFYCGDPVEMLMLNENGKGEIISISNIPGKDFNPQQLVPKGTWQGTRLKPDGKFALLGATVSPAFLYEDFVLVDCNKLISQYPDFKEVITEMAI